MAGSTTGQTFTLKRTIERKVGALPADVTMYRLTTVPYLTTIAINFNETRNRALQVDADDPGASRYFRKMSIALETYFLDLAEKP